MSETATKQQIDEARTWRADDKYIMRDGVQIGSFITAELAESAVRAVNSHEALVEALELFVRIYPPNARKHPDVAIAIGKAGAALGLARKH